MCKKFLFINGKKDDWHTQDGPPYYFENSQQKSSDIWKGSHILWKHVDHTATDSFMTHPTDPLLRDGDVPGSRRFAVRPLANQELGLGLDILRLLQAGHNPRLAEHRIGRAHATAEIEFQIFDRESLGDQF
ncbi:uncharacterized protein LDX57_001468 [Aspergillus melleus]|uniref:uncharacterized protein n=1 Tax=Aspergillus melleus TaxID=138277 RepID=UPI001E8D3F12|nr:uncharacterized protein LDX57_001468 [Aspergillus melleus]KAH8423712.1 hypothetical protein LDX57_001468 [Aspergillus melleus]